MNEVVLIGNLTKDPELRETNKGSVCGFTLAVSDRKKDNATGEWVDNTDFLSIIVWGKQGENCSRFLSKGSKCAVHGKIKTSNYTNKEGQKVYKTDIVANNVEFLSQKDSQEQKPQENIPAGFEAIQEEIPF